MEALFTVSQGWFLLAVYAAAMLAVVPLFSRIGSGKAEFLLAGRSLTTWPAAFSIAATWIWAPALFIAAQKAYYEGIAGVFWFTVPNVLTLVLFGFFAARLRRDFPEGYTLSGFIRERFSRRVQGLYLVQLIGLAVSSFAVQLLAGGVLIAALTGIPFLQVTLALAAIALSYSLWSGLRASVMTDWLQMVLIAVGGLILVPWVVASAGGVSTVVDGLAGHTGTYGSIFSGDGATVFFSFGIAVTIGLMSGPFGDQSFYQRAFAIREREIRRAFLVGAAVFALVPLLMATLGFVAAGSGLEIENRQLVNLETLLAFLPMWTAVPFALILLSGLVSTLDSNLCAVSAMAGHDLAPGGDRRGQAISEGPEPSHDPDRLATAPVTYARLGMVLLALAALAIANLPGMQILYLFLFYGTLRASTFLPTVLAVLWPRVREPGMFWGILAAIAIGLPVFVYGNFGGGTSWVIAGSLLTITLSGGLAWSTSLWLNRHQALTPKVTSP